MADSQNNKLLVSNTRPCLQFFLIGYSKKRSLTWIYLLKTGQAFKMNVFLILKSHVKTISITEIFP